MHLASSPSSAVPQTSCAVPITSPVGRDRAILCGRGKRGTGPSARRRPLPDCANRGGFLHSESTCLLSGNNIANFSLPLVTALADERHWPRMACHSNLCIRSCPVGILCTSDGGQRQTLPQLSHRRLCKCGASTVDDAVVIRRVLERGNRVRANQRNSRGRAVLA